MRYTDNSSSRALKLSPETPTANITELKIMWNIV